MRVLCGVGSMRYNKIKRNNESERRGGGTRPRPTRDDYGPDTGAGGKQRARLRRPLGRVSSRADNGALMGSHYRHTNTRCATGNDNERAFNRLAAVQRTLAATACSVPSRSFRSPFGAKIAAVLYRSPRGH